MIFLTQFKHVSKVDFQAGESSNALVGVAATNIGRQCRPDFPTVKPYFSSFLFKNIVGCCMGYKMHFGVNSGAVN